jgi:ribosomal protein L11 methyltransferase
VIRLALRVPREDAEVVLAELLELAPAGVEEIDHLPRDGEPAVVEYAVYGTPGELPALPDLQSAVAGALVDISTSEVPDDWAERWKLFHRPVLIEAPSSRVPSLHVRPPWEAPLDRANVSEIAIDPAQAFGTGSHATTRMCLELLLELAASDPARGAVLDVGAGSGVLSIAAAKLGYQPVVALDNDRESVAATAANAAVNGVEIETHRIDLRTQALPHPASGEGAPCEQIVLANLLRPLLLDLAGSIQRPPAHLIASGLLREEATDVSDAFAESLGLSERARRESGEWAALWLVSAIQAR